MSTQPDDDLSQLIEEFQVLGKRDQKAILLQLNAETRERLQNKLDSSKKSEDADTARSANEANDIAPWLFACLDETRRNDFPALRTRFSMTAQAKDSLHRALSANSPDELVLEKIDAVVTAESTAPGSRGPSLMGSLTNLLSKKLSML